MAIKTIHGTCANEALGEELETALSQSSEDGTLYFGYPILPIEEGKQKPDALLVGPGYGVIVFSLPDESQVPKSPEAWEPLRDRLDSLHAAISSKLQKNRSLVQRRRLAVPILTFVLVRDKELAQDPSDESITLVDPKNLVAKVRELRGGMPEGLLAPLNASLERVSDIKPREKRNHVQKDGSKGAILRKIEMEIANLDAAQKQGAIESPRGPQRLRGLAGSGKTIVLALKAAYLHAEFPEWRIVITFYTRSLKQQLEDLIRRFYFNQTEDEPDWERIQILPAWGSDRSPGFYSTVARSCGEVPMSLDEAKNHFGFAEPFSGACRDLLQKHAKHTPQHQAIFDAVLIDEGQDLPQAFFELAWLACKPPHRVVWAYDELQNLNASKAIASPEQLFGASPEGRPRVTIENRQRRPKQDIVLPKCYRNTSWALTAAHAIGLGVYRREGPVQWLDAQDLWTAIGYEVIDGEWEPGNEVVLRRRSDSSPEFFEDLIAHDDAVQWRCFDSDEEQLSQIISSIQHDLESEELLPHDILVVFPDPYTYKGRAGRLQARLHGAGIDAQVVGVTSSPESFSQSNHVSISGIHRAKGNEAAMVYVLDSEYAAEKPEMAKRRNTLFTAITRSRAWVRVWGTGQYMAELCHEFEQVKNFGFEMRVTIPTDEQKRKMRDLHRDTSRQEKYQRDQDRRALETFNRMSPESFRKVARSDDYKAIKEKLRAAQ